MEPDEGTNGNGYSLDSKAPASAFRRPVVPQHSDENGSIIETEVVGADVFWKDAKRMSLDRRREKRASLRSPPTTGLFNAAWESPLDDSFEPASSSSSASSRWGQVRSAVWDFGRSVDGKWDEIAKWRRSVEGGKLNPVSEDPNASKDLEPSQRASFLWDLGAAVDENFNELAKWRSSAEGNHLANGKADVAPCDNDENGERRPSALWELGSALDEKISELARWRKSIEGEEGDADRDSSPGAEVFWSGDRRGSLTRRLENRTSRQRPSEAIQQNGATDDLEADGSPRGWPRVKSLLTRLGFSLEDEVVSQNGTRDQQVPRGRPSTLGVVTGSVEEWRASTAVAAGRTMVWLQARMVLRKLGVQLDDEEAQVLVECLCEPEGPWQPFERPLPLSQVARCASALWEAEESEPQQKADPATNNDCVQA